jgi:superfamily II DNA or RNA helicase
MGIGSASAGLDQLLASLSSDGNDFERLCQWFLQNDPFWSAIFAKVWLWDDWPGRWGRDRGIDLIADTPDGRTFAIQAKNYGPAHSITKADVDTFLSESNRAVIAERLLIGSTDVLSPSGREVMAAQEKPVTTCLLEQLNASDLEWPASMADLRPAELPPAQPREHQAEALAAIERWAASDESRGQVVMACGTGKSLVGVWAADRLAAARVLVLVPSLALLRQTASTWARHATTPRRLVLVCSDTRRSDLEDVTRGDELGNLRTTEPAAIANALQLDGPVLIVSTYNSSPALARAMAGLDVAFDLAIVDEAHRCAGFEASGHKTVLDDEAIRARRRLFFTATPTIYGLRDKSRARQKNVKVASMDDRTKFGAVIHHLSYAEATRRELLCPYQVAVIPIHDDEVHRLIKDHRIVTADGDEHVDAASLATQIACARAMRRYGCKRMVAYHRGIRESKRFAAQFRAAAELLPSSDGPEGELWSAHVDGDKMRPAERAQLLRRFSDDDYEGHRLLSNVKLLAEGVDIPGIDSVAFIDTRRGQASVIQAVGRAVRCAPGKSVGTIVLPIVLRDGESFEAALARSDHRPIVAILGALRSHDPEIARSLDDIRFSYGPDNRPKGTGRFVVDAPLHVGRKFADAVGLALTTALGVAPVRSPSRRIKAQPQVIEPLKELSEEEKFRYGVDEVSWQGRHLLLPAVPPTAREFPLDVWWEEAKQRWREDTLEVDHRRAIAESLSWLAPDLADEPAIRDEMIAWTDADVPEQLLSQLRDGGSYSRGPLAPLAADERLLEEFLEPFARIHSAVTHAAMSVDQQLDALTSALQALAAVLDPATGDIGPDDWAWESRRLAIVDGFAHTLARAEYRFRIDAPPDWPWRKRTHPDAYTAGSEAATLLEPTVHYLAAFRFAGDRDAVASRRDDEETMKPDERFDELGWDIYMLARRRGATWSDATRLAMDGNLRQRQGVRADLLARFHHQRLPA